MEAAAYRAAKMQVVEHMLQGHPWHKAVAAAGLRISRSTAYHLLKRVRTEGEVALAEGRHGHPTKLRPPVRQWLEGYWQVRPGATCREAQAALEERFGVRVSQSHLSRVRIALGVTSHLQSAGEKGGVLIASRANLPGGSGESVAARGGPRDGVA
jgi:transposase